MDIRLLTDEDYVPYMRSFMRAMEQHFGIGGAERAAYQAQGLNDALLAEMFAWDFNDIQTQLLTRVRRYVPRANLIDRMLHRRQILRFQQSIWRLSHFFPPGWTTIGRQYGYNSPAQLLRMEVNEALEEKFNVSYLNDFKTQRDDTKRPAREWVSAGTIVQFTELLEMAWMFSRHPDLFAGMETNHPMSADETYERTLHEFIAATRDVFKIN